MGPYSIDRFASPYNTQLARFNSRFWSPSAEAIDAFTLDWSQENNWLCPPVCLITRVIPHLRACSAQGTLIVPFWPSASFWPVLVPQPEVFMPGVIDSFTLPRVKDTFIPGRGQTLVYKRRPSIFTGTPLFRVLGVRFEYSRYAPHIVLF